MKKLSTDILICGGGIPGLALACLLGALDINVSVIDKFPPKTLKETQSEGRTSALMQSSLRILEATGAWNTCGALGEELRTLRIIDDSTLNADQAMTVDFRANEIGLDAFGVNIPNNVLRAALYDRAKKLKNITMLMPDALTEYSTEGGEVTAKLESGKTVTAKLLVGSDGRKSAVRELSGIGVKEKNYGQSAITCLLDHTKHHDYVSTEYHRPSGPFTLVPMPGNVSSLVWVEHNEDANEFIKMSKHAIERVIQDKSRNSLGKISLKTNPVCCPLISLKAKSLTASRTVLIAEAAHVIHPMGAQGLNLSLRDAAILAESIVDAMRLGQDVGSKAILDRYAVRRKPDTMSRIIGTDGLNRFVSNDYGLLRNIRRTGLKAVGNVPALKSLAMHEGLAPTHDEGRIAAGGKL